MTAKAWETKVLEELLDFSFFDEESDLIFGRILFLASPVGFTVTPNLLDLEALLPELRGATPTGLYSQFKNHIKWLVDGKTPSPLYHYGIAKFPQQTNTSFISSDFAWAPKQVATQIMDMICWYAATYMMTEYEEYTKKIA